MEVSKNVISHDVQPPVIWQLAEVSSPLLDHTVKIIAAKDIPYMANANRFQTLHIYLPYTPETIPLIGTVVNKLPAASLPVELPRYLVHIHGGAWRDARLTADSIEPTVAYAFGSTGNPTKLSAIASLNYTISPYPEDLNTPYDAIKENHSDIAREAMHPQHVSDVLHGLILLRTLGITNRSYILSGHSCGACIAFQAILQSPQKYGLSYLQNIPLPEVILGLNGLYDLPGLVYGLDQSHEHLQNDYRSILINAFGHCEKQWAAASPARFDAKAIAELIAERQSPRLIVLDHSPDDQLVPVNQQELLKANLQQVQGLQLAEGRRCSGPHATPWQQGLMIWQNIQDILSLLKKIKLPGVKTSQD